MTKRIAVMQGRQKSGRAERVSTYARYGWVWRIVGGLMRPFMVRKFNFECDSCFVEGPCLVVSNHITNWDPFLLALSFPKKPLYFVASEHIFRWGLISKLIEWLAAPIPRSKGASGVGTVLECISRVRGGGSIALFAEGDCTWDGRSQNVVPSTGKFAKLCNATLITHRFEGLHFTLPRWGKAVRRGRSGGRIVGVYAPEQLAHMSGEEISALIDRDIFEDALARQAEEPVDYKSKAAAEYIETAVFMCPQCGRIGSLTSRGNTVSCQCGFSRRMTERGVLEPDEPFNGVAQWDIWQRERLESAFSAGQAELFCDEGMTLTEIMPNHGRRNICTGVLRQGPHSLACEGVRFPLADISGMAIVETKALLFSCNGSYYELRPQTRCCLRKYLTAWQIGGRQNDK